MGFKDKQPRNISVKWLWITAGIVVVSGSAAGYFYYLKHKQTTVAKPATKVATVKKPAPPAKPVSYSAAEAGILPWSLNAPLSRMAVFAGTSPNQIVIAGGLDAQGGSAIGVYSMDVANGNQGQIGQLPASVHDAAAAKINNQYFIFGGGVSNSVSTVTGVSSKGTVASSSQLPNKRSDASAATLNGVTYIVGGYNGSSADADVLTTSDGVHFTKLGQLPVPVRYAAVAASGNLVYVFGGIGINGSQSGKPVDTVQIIDPSSHSISTASWHLPVPLDGAAAFTIGQETFLAGGQSTIPQTITPGVGTTQVSGVTVASKSLTQNSIWAVDTQSGKFLNAGRLQLPISNSGVAVIGNRAWLIGGEYNGQPVSSVQMVTPNSQFGTAGQPGAGSPYYGGKLLIADRGNNRLLTLDSSMNIIWKYPSSSTSSAAAKGFYFPDDAFFINHGTGIISNQEANETLIQMSYPSGKINWQFGHPLQIGSAYGYLNEPDDAYLLKNGDVVTADDRNCRVLFISPAGKVVGQIGETGVCVHNPNVSLGSPNGDTPLFNGNVLISEIDGAWVSEYTPQGKMVWTTHIPISYPSDPQQLGAGPGKNPDNYLIADFSSPGAFLRFNREGQVLYRYQPTSGQGRLDHPSLVEQLPSGVYMANDDYRNRMVAIDPATNALVWQYGVNDQNGTTPGMLNTPDGFDILMANGTTPTHGMTK